MNIESTISFVNIGPAMALLDCYGSLVPRPHPPASGMRRVHARGPNIYCIPGVERVERVLSMHNWAWSIILQCSVSKVEGREGIKGTIQRPCART